MDLKGIAMRLSPLQQLLEDINFQRTKEMRNMMKDDDSGFVMLHGNTQWTDIFVRHFLFENQKKAAIDSDDLLFFVRKKYIKESSRSNPKYLDEIEVFRKDSKKLPIGCPDVFWEETVYLNLVIHQFNYYLTLAICTRTSPKELQILKRHSQRVYASPSRRKMDSKGESEEITYPHICFMVDNFDEVFHDILVRDGEMVCVELVAKDLDGTTQGVIFLGSIRYDALKKVYDARQSSLSSKMAQRMTFGLFNSAPQTRCEFVRMKGPGNKGFAEMAVTKPKGSGIETPTSEPGFCMTDMFDSECEEDLDEAYNNRHQRRLSDPSANLNNFSKNGWRTTKPANAQGYGNSKALSQNEGLDSLANEVWEIEAGDVRDDRPALSQSDTKLATIHRRRLRSSQKAGNSKAIPNLTSPSACCGDCFIPTTGARNSIQLSDIYTPSSDHITNSPDCLSTISRQKPPDQVKTLLNVESEIEYSKNFNKKLNLKKSPQKVRGGSKTSDKVEQEIYEIASEADDIDSAVDTEDVKIGIMTENDKRNMIRVNGKEELPCVEEKNEKSKRSSLSFLKKSLDVRRSPKKSAKRGSKTQSSNNNNNNNNENEQPVETTSTKDESDKRNNNCDEKESENVKYSTLPLVNKQKHKKSIAIPQRITSDGTKIFYLCDLPKKIKKELDDGQYNPLWTSKGFTQNFHFWKENRRQSSTPLNSFLTYVSLPWFSIAKDLLDHREMPILTF